MRAIFITFLTLVSSIVLGSKIGVVKFNGSFHVTLNKTESLKVNATCESLSITGRRDIDGKYITKFHCNIPRANSRKNPEKIGSQPILDGPNINKDALNFETDRAWSTYNYLTNTIETMMSLSLESAGVKHVKSEDFNASYVTKPAENDHKN